jgi:hypothetical protein
VLAAVKTEFGKFGGILDNVGGRSFLAYRNATLRTEDQLARVGFMDAACWLFEGSRLAAGTHLPGENIDLAKPNGWRFEGSISERFSFVPNEECRSAP